MKFAFAGSTVLLVTAGRLLSAQSLTAPSEWSFVNAQGGFCIEYLIEPALAGKLAPKDAILAPAGRGDGLLAPLMRDVQDEPKFGRWIPATLCIGLYRSVNINDKLIAQMKGNQPILVVTHTLATTSYKGAATPAVLIGFFTDNSVLRRTAEKFGQQMDEATRVVIEREGAEFPTWLIEFKGVKLRWAGGPTSDASVAKTRSVSFGYTGSHGNVWNGALQVTIPEARTLIGSLGVDGKNNIAKALIASPDRVEGAMESGGGAKISFATQIKR